jgi:predicted alpha/beta-fold hydrolase
MILSEPFKPPFYLESARLQTFLASFRVRAFGDNPMVAAARPMVLKTAEGVRLLGAYSPRKRPPKKGLVILIHGWEGSADSTYMLTTGRRLYENGYDLFRLNLRDHGLSHHLNEGLFFATRFDEVFESVKQAARLSKGRPVFLAGFSLGGNFALRIARACAKEEIQHLRHVVAISPALDPNKATDKIDSDPLVLRYFLKKWTRSLKKKQSLFPARYDFERALQFRNLRKITDVLLPDHTEFRHSRTYFKAYSLLGEALTAIPIPTTIIAAADDPVIPVEDFHRLRLNRKIRLVIHRHGGHIGFVENLSMGCWHERKMVQLFDRLVTGEGLTDR